MHFGVSSTRSRIAPNRVIFTHAPNERKENQMLLMKREETPKKKHTHTRR